MGDNFFGRAVTMQHSLRFALRSIWRSKVFALTAIVAFSFGIGATATVFSVIDAVLLHPATFPDAASMVSIQTSGKNESVDDVRLQVYAAIRARTDLFSEVAGYRNAIFTVTRVPSPDQVFGLSVSGNYFGMAGARPWRGRLVQPEDDRPGAPAGALLSYKAWQQLSYR